MTPQERELIMKVADRLQQAGPQTKDAEAEQLIRQQVTARPDSAYLLTQTVIVQDYALEQAQQRIQTLEQQLQQAQQHQTSTPAPAAGGFLGGLFGGANPTSTSTPGPASAAPSAASQAAAKGNPGGTSSAAGSAGLRPAAARNSAPPAAPPRPQAASQQTAQRGGMGDFMRSAAAMAVGVAGGHLLFNGLQGLFGDEQAGGADAAEVADTSADTPADAADADSGGWGADQGVSEEALAGDSNLWEEPAASDDSSGWGDTDTATDGAADGGFADHGVDDGGFDDAGLDEDWG